MEFDKKHPFTLPEKYECEYTPVKKLPGSLWLARKYDSNDGDFSIVVKKCMKPFESVDRAKRLLRQLHLLRTIKHENIVRLIGAYTVKEDNGEEAIYTINSYCGDPLSERIEKGDYTMEDVKKWAREMLMAVQHLHSNGIVHRNLRPGNIGIDANNKLTLLDFGKDRSSRKSDRDSDRGINQYSPLELIVEMKKDYDEKVDIWSIGALLFDLITGFPLFDEKNPLNQQIQFCGPVGDSVIAKMKHSKDRAHFTDILMDESDEQMDFITLMRENLDAQTARGITDEDIVKNADALSDFIDGMLQYDQEQRMSTSQAISHPFLRHSAPWKCALPEDETLALDELKSRIRQEIETTTL